MKHSGAHVDAPWRYERIEGAGHWMQLDAPDRVNELLRGVPVRDRRRAAGGVRRPRAVAGGDDRRRRRARASSGAFITLTLDAAREQARAAERAYARGEARPLEGLTLAVKDLFDTAGVRTTYGSRIYADHVPDADAALVRRREGGGRDRRRQDAHARVRVGHHERQPALPAVPQPVRPRARARRLERRLGGRAGDRRGGARARHRHRRLDPDPGRVLRRVRAQADVRPAQPRRRPSARAVARPRRPDGAHARRRQAVLRGARRAAPAPSPRCGSRSAPTCTCARSSPGIQRAFDAAVAALDVIEVGFDAPEQLYATYAPIQNAEAAHDARRALPVAPRRVRRRRRRPARHGREGHARRVRRGDDRARADPGRVPDAVHAVRPAADADLRRPAGADRAADPSGASATACCPTRSRRTSPACRRAPCRSASTTTACRSACSSPARRAPRAACSPPPSGCTPLQHRRGRDPRLPRDLRDQHRDLVHEAPAPVLARLQRADERMLAPTACALA